ncbi:DUF1641 domain-containing protein [Thermoproteus tenax]|nr:DUF1641 domain-containing protein [Thermoproteus tenax]
MVGDYDMSAQQNVDQKVAELLKTLAEHADELQALVEQLIELKRTGVLDALMIVVNRFEELIHYVFQDPAIMRLASLGVDGTLGGLSKLETQDVINMKASLQELIVRLGKGLTPDALINPKPVKGIWGLLSALNDPDVQRGLGVAFALLKALGKTQ